MLYLSNVIFLQYLHPSELAESIETLTFIDT